MMNGYERMKAALSLETVEEIAVNPEVIQHALEITGNVHSRYSTDPEIMADAQIRTLEHYGYDSVYISSDNYILCEAFGGEVSFPYDEPPQLISPALRTGDISSLMPLTAESGRVNVILKATEICKKRLAEKTYVKTCIDSAPFSAAACTVGPERFMVALFDEEDWIPDLLEFCTDQIVKFGCLAAEAGADGLAFGDSVSALISREMYEEIALPFAKKAVSRLKEETGLPVFYHVCGDTNRILDLMVATGADCIEIDSMVDKENAHSVSKGKCCVLGNVSTVEALLNGTPDDVNREAMEMLSVFGKSGGLILSGACEIPRKTPVKNLEEMVRAAREFSGDN